MQQQQQTVGSARRDLLVEEDVVDAWVVILQSICHKG
jgi:hypothetical protein